MRIKGEIGRKEKKNENVVKNCYDERKVEALVARPINKNNLKQIIVKGFPRRGEAVAVCD